MRARRILLLGALGCLAVLVARWSLREGPRSPPAGHPPGDEVRHLGEAGHTDAPVGPRRLRPGDTPPDAALVDQNGTAFRLSDLRGHPVVLAFLYTHCDVASMCPTTARTFARLKALAAADGLGEVEFLLVSFDPERDTPERLRVFAEEQQVAGAGLRMATGAPEEVRRLAQSLNTYFQRQTDDRFEHNLVVSVLDAEGELAGWFAGASWGPDELLATLAEAAG